MIHGVSQHCLNGNHSFCREPATCQCSTCHLGPCQECGATNLQRLFDHPFIPDRSVCAACYRPTARRNQAQQPCDKCGAVPAWRNPATKRNEYFCRPCHAETGDVIVLPGSAAKLVAPCKGLDINDDRHTWVHIRANRFQCRCGAKKYDNELRKQVRDDYLRSSG